MTQAEKLVWAATFSRVFTKYSEEGNTDRLSGECAAERAHYAVVALRGVDPLRIDNTGPGKSLEEFRAEDPPMMVITGGPAR
jgi:hypothetical protein